MAALFHDIDTFIAQRTYGPVAALVSDVDTIRYCIIQPFNYYAVYRDRAIYLVMPASFRSPSFVCNDSFVTGKFTANSLKIVCSNASFHTVYNVFDRHDFRKVILSREMKPFSLADTLNMCIQHGIFLL